LSTCSSRTTDEEAGPFPFPNFIADAEEFGLISLVAASSLDMEVDGFGDCG
jgi:hypothetical protein